MRLIEHLEPRRLMARPDDLLRFDDPLQRRQAQIVPVEVLAPVQFEQMRTFAAVLIPQDGGSVELGGFEVNIPKGRKP